MKLKTSCSAWLAVYVVLSLAIGAVVYRRFPVGVAALIAALVGGFFAWLGVAYFVAIFTKIRDAQRLRRADDAEPPRDGEKIAVVGTIEPVSGKALTAPITGAPAVAYKYEVRSPDDEDHTLFEGFALTPSVIQSSRGQIGLFANPELQFDPVEIVNAAHTFSAYVDKTQFERAGLENLRAAFTDMKALYSDDDGSIRQDLRLTDSNAALKDAQFKEWIVRPGDRISAVGTYSAARGGFVPDGSLQPLIIRRVSEHDAAPMPRALRGAIGSLIGAVICLAIAAAGVIGVFAFVPLAAAEQMSPRLMPAWVEIRGERLLERRLRPRLREMGLMDSGTASIMMSPEEARGRVAGGGGETFVHGATAVCDGEGRTIHIDGDAVVLTLDSQAHLTRLTIRGAEVDPSPDDVDLDVELTSDCGALGRLTYFREGAPSPACRVTFHAVAAGSR